MQPQASYALTATPLGSYSTTPVHAIDASWNQTRRVNADLLSGGKYYGYDLDSYIAMTGNVPKYIPESDSLNTQNGADPYGNLATP